MFRVTFHSFFFALLFLSSTMTESQSIEGNGNSQIFDAGSNSKDAESTDISKLNTPEIPETARKDYYFLKHGTNQFNTDEITKRYTYLLDLSPLFKKFFQQKANKDIKFKDVIDKIEVKSAVKAHKLGEGDNRRRKSEKEEDEELLRDTTHQSDIIEFTESPSYVQGGKLREYQVQGLNWLINLRENNLSGILADEMGLGKTLQTIAFLGYLKFFKHITGPHLIIVPKSTLENWQREFSKWVPEFNTIILTGDKEQRLEIVTNDILPCNFDVIITSYELVIKEKATLRKFSWNYIIIDEAHRLKNEKSLLSQVIRELHSSNRLLITGTPLQNNLHELWALLNFLLPDVFSDSETFDEYFGSSAEDDSDLIKQLHTILSPFLLRRIKSQVEKSLLPKKELNLYVKLSSLQKTLYKKLLERDLDAVNGLNGKKESKTRLLNIVMQLRKCCNHPYLFDGVEPGPPYTTDEHLVNSCGKLKILDRLLSKFKAEGSRVLIFSQMSRMLDILEDYCYLRNYGYCRIDGSTDHQERIKAIDDYNKPDSDRFVFLLTTRAGGLGINLTSADVVILYDSDWNPQADLQAMDRAHRIGQKKQVKVFRLVTDNSIEEKVLERAMKKLRLDQVVIQQAKNISSTNQKVEKNELLNMIRFGAQEIFDNEDDAPDEELEEILSNSESRTNQLNKKYSSLGFDELQDFSSEKSSAYQWDGTDYKKLNHTNKIGSGIAWINPGKRERKENYSIDKYYKNVLNTGGRTTGTEAKTPRAPKQLNLYDHQFYDPKLYELNEKEKLWYKRQIGYKSKKPAAKGKQVFSNKDLEFETRLEQFEVDHAIALTEEEEQLKEELLTHGYGQWSRREFNHFIQLSGKYGRYSIEAIAKEMMENSVVVTQKSHQEIEEYAGVFWTRYQEIDGYEKYILLIEQGEERIARQLKQHTCLNLKIAQYDIPLKQLTLKFPPGSYVKAAYTEEEDAFILVGLFSHGTETANVYELVHHDIMQSNMFKFDFFLKSRSISELTKRGNSLLAAVVKEYDVDVKSLATQLEKKRRLLEDKGRSKKKPKKRASKKRK